MAKQRRSREQLLATAYHEAGHAVVNLHFRLPIEEVSIIRKGDRLGVMVHLRPEMLEVPRREYRTIARQIILGCYAGLHAQRLVDPEPHPDHGKDDVRDACQLSREYLVLPRRYSAIGDDEHMAFLERLNRQARNLVRQLRKPISVLAARLLKRRRMSGKECERALSAYF